MIHPFEYYVITNTTYAGNIFFYLNEQVGGRPVVRLATSNLSMLSLQTLSNNVSYRKITSPVFKNFSSVGRQIIPLGIMSYNKYYYVPALKEVVFGINEGNVIRLAHDLSGHHFDKGLRSLSCFEIPFPQKPKMMQ